MTRNIAAWLFVMAFCVLFVPVQATAAVAIGEKVTDFSLVDVRTGKEVALNQISGRSGVALIFVATQCPYSNAFNKVMSDVAKEYRAHGITVVGINSNKTEPVEEVRRHAEGQGLDFVVLKDEGRIAEQFGATRTPEVFLLDKQMIVRYHGAIGNSKMPTTNPAQTKADDLRPALDAVAKGAPVQVAETKAFGCTIKR
ncbi:MAG: redoxin domain-containing protein [Acidobacteriota bacterium]